MHKDIIVGSMPAYHSYPDSGGKHPGLVVIHEIWGLDEHIKNVADRFAAQGYSVVAPNLFHNMSFDGKIGDTLHDELHNPETRDEAQKKMRALLAPIMTPEFAASAIADLKQCLDYLLTDAGVNGAVGVLGFCFGGSFAFHLAANDSRIKAAVPFYGQPPKQDEIGNITCPILAFYGDQDTGLMQTLPQLKEDMKKRGKKFEAVVYPNVGHAFFNDTNARMFNADAAKEAWEKSLQFLKKNLIA